MKATVLKTVRRIKPCKGSSPFSSATEVKLKYCTKGFALEGGGTCADFAPITGVDAEVQGAVASFKCLRSSDG